MSSILIDKDILLDCLNITQENNLNSIKLLELCKRGDIKAWVSEHSVSEVCKLISQSNNLKEFFKRLKDLLEIFGVLSINKDIIYSAISRSDMDYSTSIQYEVARSAGIGYIVTNSPSLYSNSGNPEVLTPEAFIDRVKNQEVGNIPPLDLKPELHAFWDETQKELGRVIFSTSFILGDTVKRFEDEFARYCGVEHCIGVASGSDALLISLMAIDVGPGDAVITTPYTFFATVGAIARLFALPVFVDIDPTTYNIDPNGIEELIRKSCYWDGETLWIETPGIGTSSLNLAYFPKRRRVKAIIPVHLFGQTANMERVMEIAKKYNLYVIEDAAQAHGAECWMGGSKSKRIGSIGHLGCFSFFPTKNLGGWGDGGAVTTGDPNLAEKVRVLRVHGSKPKYYHKFVGINSRLDTVQAAVLLAKLPYLDRWIEKRQKVAMNYMDLLHSNGNIALPEVAGYTARHVWNQFVVRINGNGRRDQVQKKLKEKGIGTGVYYPLPLHMQECFSYVGYREGDFPNSEKAARETLALPMFPELGRKEQEEISRRLEEVL
jgi:dTDP-4-amino-4,6-dideoxygalactose transaminase